MTLASGDFSNLVAFASFMASFQSPFSAYLAESKGSKSYLVTELLSFVCLVTAAVLGIIQDQSALAWLAAGVLLAVLTYLNVVLEEVGVSSFEDF